MTTINKVNIFLIFSSIYLTFIITTVKAYYINANDVILIQLFITVMVLGTYYYYINNFKELFSKFNFINMLILNLLFSIVFFSLFLELMCLVKHLIIDDSFIVIDENKPIHIITFLNYLKSFIIGEVDCAFDDLQLAIIPQGEVPAAGPEDLDIQAPNQGPLFIIRPLILGAFSFGYYMFFFTPLENPSLISNAIEQAITTVDIASDFYREQSFFPLARQIGLGIGLSISQSLIFINNYTSQVNRLLPYRLLRNVASLRLFVRRQPLLSFLLLTGCNIFITNG